MVSCAPGILAAKNLALVSRGTILSTAPATICVGMEILASAAGSKAGPSAGAMAKMARTRGSRWDFAPSRRAACMTGLVSARAVALAVRPGNSGGSVQRPSALGDLQKIGRDTSELQSH